MLFGGLSLIRDTETLDIVKIPIEDFSICAIHPDIKINTEYLDKYFIRFY